MKEESVREKDALTALKLIHQQDFKLLRAQKSLLVNMLGKKSTTEAEHSALEGILNLIDTIQDIACDQYEHNPLDVYNFTKDGDPNEVRVSIQECRKIVLEN